MNVGSTRSDPEHSVAQDKSASIKARERNVVDVECERPGTVQVEYEKRLMQAGTRAKEPAIKKSKA